MGDNSKIEWTEATWNPIRARNNVTGRVGWHCTKPSPGCKNCYAERGNKWIGSALPYVVGSDVQVFLDNRLLRLPLRWTRGRMIFPCSMTDLFGEWVSDKWLVRIFAVMALTPHHTYQITTKRAKRMREFLDRDGIHYRIVKTAMALAEQHKLLIPAETYCWPLGNVWAGVSIEDQARYELRRHDLVATPATLRWVSYEPALEYVDFEPLLATGMVHWLVIGGESGPQARPFHVNWAADNILAGHRTGVPIFMKQTGANVRGSLTWTDWPKASMGADGRVCGLVHSKGGDPAEWLPVLRVRQMPKLHAYGLSVLD